MAIIGIVEDDMLLNAALKRMLVKEGYEVRTATSLREGEHLCEEPVDLLVIDWNLPDGEGIRLCGKAGRGKEILSILLTAKDEEEDIIRAFDAGADDYITKPFSTRILIKRVQAVLRRAEEKKIVSCQGLTLDFEKKQVWKHGEEILLTPKEFSLFEFLAKNKGRTLTKENILDAVWDKDGSFVGENTISVTINRLRKKIETDCADPVYIKNVFGIGYRFGE